MYEQRVHFSSIYGRTPVYGYALCIIYMYGLIEEINQYCLETFQFEEVQDYVKLYFVCVPLPSNHTMLSGVLGRLLAMGYVGYG